MKMMICQACKGEFPQAAVINGVRKTYHMRKFCLKCSPNTRKNTKDITKYPLARVINGVIHKTCRGCKKELPYTADHFYMKSVWGITRAMCMKCSRIAKNRRVNEKKRWAVEYKGGKCVFCGYNKYIGALDFHHINPAEKDFLISGGKFDRNKLKLELDRCILVCSNCHREIHGGERRIDDVRSISGIFQLDGKVGVHASVNIYKDK